MASNDAKILSGKTALITGGSRGIGRAIAEAYARQGAQVFICARDEKNLRAAIDEMQKSGGEIAGLAGDVGNQEDVQRIVSAAVERYGAIHILVNNASILGPRETIANYPPAAWEEVLRINLTGLFLMTRAVLPAMRRREPDRLSMLLQVSVARAKHVGAPMRYRRPDSKR